MARFTNLAAHAVYGGVHGWLTRESSLANISVAEDDFDEIRKSELKTLITEELPYFITSLPEWFDDFEKDPSDDYASALISFAGLTIISRAYRVQSYLQSQSIAEYLHKQKKGSGIDMARSTRIHFNRIGATKMSFEEARVSLELLDRQKDNAISVGSKALVSVVNRLNQGMDLGEENSPSIKSLKCTQRASLTFVNTNLLLSAKNRGNLLSAIPLLQPKNISSLAAPEVRYPFAGQSYT